VHFVGLVSRICYL